ncbi:BLUF domain-containing protein [Brevundimonas sp. TWP2-3-2]|uniref:BLUF domain-containing protein n=1 Tax=unclassified Brevundimonas TaxID=2622653 RepID=UPI003CE8AB82
MRWKRVIYCSNATVSMENALNLAEILGVSARNNQRDEITGLLAHAGGIFIQAVEGPPHAVDALMARLRSDTRHRDLRVLGEDVASERAFPAWVMETPKMRPDRTLLLRELVESCEVSYGTALKLMLEMADDQEYYSS